MSVEKQDLLLFAASQSRWRPHLPEHHHHSSYIIQISDCLGWNITKDNLTIIPVICPSLSLCLSSSLSSVITGPPVTGSVFHHFYWFGLYWHSPEGWWGPNWKFWFRKLQSSGSFGNLVISQIVKNVNIKVSVHLSIYWIIKLKYREYQLIRKTEVFEFIFISNHNNQSVWRPLWKEAKGKRHHILLKSYFKLSGSTFS